MEQSIIGIFFFRCLSLRLLKLFKIFIDFVRQNFWGSFFFSAHHCVELSDLIFIFASQIDQATHLTKETLMYLGVRRQHSRIVADVVALGTVVLLLRDGRGALRIWLSPHSMHLLVLLNVRLTNVDMRTVSTLEHLGETAQLGDPDEWYLGHAAGVNLFDVEWRLVVSYPWAGGVP